jgi:L-amino acid N-acyltransferase
VETRGDDNAAVRIEDAEERDLPGIVAILNDVIATSTAVFSDTPVTLDEQRRWLRLRRERGFPVLVAREGDEVLAYASYGEFRSHAGYRTTVEHTVHVAPGSRRRGIGGALVVRLVELAREHGMHVMVAGVDAANAPSIALHEQLGFVEAARMPEIAQKSGRWVDLVLLTLRL